MKRFGLPFDKVLRGPIPEPLVRGGTTRHVPFALSLPAGASSATVEALLTYALIPQPESSLMEKYLATLKSEQERSAATKLIQEYAQPRVLTFRTKSL